MNTPNQPTGREAGGVLTPEDIQEFQALVKEETGVTMDLAEAWTRATELIALFRMLRGPMPEDPES